MAHSMVKGRHFNQSNKRGTAIGSKVLAHPIMQPIKSLFLVATAVLCLLLVEQTTGNNVTYLCPATAVYGSNHEERTTRLDHTHFGITKLPATDYTRAPNTSKIGIVS